MNIVGGAENRWQRQHQNERHRIGEAQQASPENDPSPFHDHHADDAEQRQQPEAT